MEWKGKLREESRISERRRMLFNRLQIFVTLAQHGEALWMFVNGSYVTGKTNPEDVDVVIFYSR